MSNVIPFNSSPFVGQFDLAGIEEQLDQFQRRYYRLLLIREDARLTALAWPGQYAGPEALRVGTKVNVTGILRGDIQLPVCKTIVVLDDPTVGRLNSLAVCRLSLMQNWLDAPELRSFVGAMMHDVELFSRFLSLPASKCHHHSYRGGLFIHSVDVALRMFGSPSIALEDKSLAVAAGLAHDIGKTVSVVGFGVGGIERHHDKLALTALASTLDALRPSYSQFVADLTMILCLRQEAGIPRDVPRRIDVLLEVLRRADHLSCAEDWNAGSPPEPEVMDD